MTHNELYQRAVDAIQAVFEDMSVPTSEVIQDMIRLKDDIDIKLSERCYMVHNAPKTETNDHI